MSVSSTELEDVTFDHILTLGLIELIMVNKCVCSWYLHCFVEVGVFFITLWNYYIKYKIVRIMVVAWAKNQW